MPKYLVKIALEREVETECEHEAKDQALDDIGLWWMEDELSIEVVPQ